MEFIKKRWFKLGIFGLIGTAAGYAYYYYVGCLSGSCPLSSNPYLMSAYGLGAGLLIGWDRKKENKSSVEEKGDTLE